MNAALGRIIQRKVTVKTSLAVSLVPLLLLGAGTPGAAGPVDTGQPAQGQSAPLRPIGECLIARHVRDWGVVNERRVVVRSLGNRYYDIQLSHRCPAMARRPLLSFRDGMQPLPLGSARGFQYGVGADPVTTDGRICGDLGDSVVPHGGFWTGDEIPCDIANVRRIDEQAFEGVLGKSTPEALDWLDQSPTLLPAGAR